MTPHIVKTLPLVVLGMALPTQAFAGAWTAKQGDQYLKGAINFFETSNRFGPEDGFENFRNTNFNVYWEYGIKDDLTFFATGSLSDLENVSDGVETSGTGVGDIDVGLRYRLFEGKLLFGKSFGDLGYGGLEVGYRIRTEDPVDEFRVLVEYGFDVSDKVYLRTKLDNIIAAQSSDNGPTDQSTVDLAINPQLPLEFDLGRLEYTAGYKISDRLGAEITGTTAVYGSNTLSGTNIQVALVAQF